MILINQQTKTVFISLSTLPEELFLLLGKAVHLEAIPPETASRAALSFLSHMALTSLMN